jgi:hypothetical protein
VRPSVHSGSKRAAKRSMQARSSAEYTEASRG